MSNQTLTRESRVSRTAAMALMFLLAIYFLLPLYFLIVAATKPQGDLASTFGLAFSHFDLFKNLGTLFSRSDGIFGRWALNSVIYAVLGAAVGTLISALCGYALAKFKFRGREFLFSVILGGVLVPTTALALPLFLLFSATGIVNTYLAVFLPSIVSPFGVYLARIFTAAAVPEEILESARLDGAGEFRTFFSVALQADDAVAGDDLPVPVRRHLEQLLPADGDAAEGVALPDHARPLPVERSDRPCPASSGIRDHRLAGLDRARDHPVHPPPAVLAHRARLRLPQVTPYHRSPVSHVPTSRRSPLPMQNSAVFVPHFHWDREWYEPFQVFRHRLVTALDTVLETAEANPDFRFTVDGQMAAIEDYLEMRPENRDRVEALVAGGQLAIGPWLILLDEFLCSGETIVRNLQMGWAAAAELGGSMPIGYLPDMFGHVAQMPQILARAGIEHAALWRGVPGSVDGHAFRWRAPDGSEVRTEFLFDGYDNGLDVLLVPDQIGRALGEYAEMTAERWGDDPVLAMAGTDHNAPDPRLAAWLRRASSDERAITIATLDEYIREHVRDEVSAVVTGELRSHVRGNILPGVLSVRLALKQRMAVAERTVDHAERMNALWSQRDDSPFLSLAWHKIIESSAHDSVVGSGTDETSDQVEARLAEATHAARAVRDAALAEPAALVPSDGYLVANPLPFPRTALVEVDVVAPPEGTVLVATAADGSAHPVQLTSQAPTVLSDERMDASQLERVLRRIHRRELFGRLIDHYELTPGSLSSTSPRCRPADRSTC